VTSPKLVLKNSYKTDISNIFTPVKYSTIEYSEIYF